jgi:membrane peptidoglycan carboxypeptidase
MVDLTKTDGATWKKSGYFDNEVAFGQYRVVPLEHAEGVSTIVNGGVHHQAHFIRQVKRVSPETGKSEIFDREKIQGNRVFGADEMSNLGGVMKKIVEVDNRVLRNGRESIAKSGTWEFNEGSGDCWFVGGIPQLSATVWVGGKGNKVELKESSGKDMFGAGTPSLIWEEFLNAATKALDMKQVDFPNRIKTGDPSKFGNGEKPVEQPRDDCVLQLIGVECNNGPGNNGNGNNGNGNGAGNDDGNNGNNGNDDGGGNTTFPFNTTPPGT